MSVDVRLKHSKTASRVPTSGDLKDGELALNLADEKVYMKNAGGTVVQVAGTGTPANDTRYVQKAPAGDASQDISGNLTLGTDKITLDASDGSINAAGSIEASGGWKQDDGAFLGNGVLYIRNDATTPTPENTIQILHKPINPGDPVSSADASFVVKSSGELRIGKGGDNIETTPAITLKVDGTAVYTGDITANGTVLTGNARLMLEPDNDNNYTTTAEEYEETIQVPVEGGVATADLVNGAPEVQYEEQTVTKTHEIKTYVGPTLDVKETLLELTAALESLKTAAANATTCDELRGAIESALGNIKPAPMSSKAKKQ